MTVQRPSPESETRPREVLQVGESRERVGGQVESHEPITEPRRQTSATSATSMSYW